MFQFRTLFDDERGASTMLFGIVALPLMGAVGVVSDYSTAAERRTLLQTALDTTTLKIAKGNDAKTNAQLQTEGDAMVRSLLATRRDLTLSAVTVTRTGQKIKIVASGDVTARFASLLGISSRTAIGAMSETTWGVRKLEIALVLDNTLSMNSSGKMAALKTAATNFINTMETVATEPGKVKISIVPFNTTVKIGTSYVGSTWLRYLSGVNAGNWNGCVADRDQPYDTGDAEPIPGTNATLYPARNCPETSLARLQTLTEDFNALRSRVTSMTPAGNTNVTIGVLWGLETLSAATPLTGAVAYDTPNLDKIMIVLTDGDNTQNRHGDSTTVMDGKTELACAAVKGRKVKVYTIRVINGDATLLRNCATAPSMYYNVTSADQLNPVFTDIARSIQNIRLTN